MEPTVTHTTPIIHIPILITMDMVLDGEIRIVGVASIMDGEVGMDGATVETGLLEKIVETEEIAEELEEEMEDAEEEAEETVEGVDIIVVK